MTASDSQSTAGRGAVVRVVEVVNKKGLHARPAARFAQMAEQFDAEVWVTGVSGERVDGSSILDLLMLSAAPGCSLTIEGTGPQARAAVDALAEFVSGGFGEDE